MRSLLIVAATALALSSGSAFAATQCRDSHGKFIKCPAPAAAQHCRDAKTGKFAKCGTAGAVPAGVKTTKH